MERPRTDTEGKGGIPGKTLEDMLREPATLSWRPLLIGGPLIAFVGFLGIYVAVGFQAISWNAPLIGLYYGIIAFGLMMVVAGLIFALLNRRGKVAKTR